jgi:HK97 family phage prohead protease
MTDKKDLTRNVDHELRAANRDDAGEQGIIEGYFARWGQVDSHNTRFQKGCFAKSIKERMNKIVIRNSHGNPIGKPLEIREDEKGAFFSGQCSLSVQEAREAFDLVRDEVVTGLSFGFQNVNDKIEKDGIRTFTEVKLLEISPTWLPSGDDSRITSVRSAEGKVEERSTDFAETVTQNTSWLLWDSIQETVSDIFWSWRFGDIDSAELMIKMDEALSAFQASFLEFSAAWVQMNESENGERKSLNELQQAVASTLESEERTVEEFATECGISSELVISLCRGNHIADLSAVKKLPENLRTLNNQLRAAEFEKGFTQLRENMSNGELKRSNSLLAVFSNKLHNCERTQSKTELRSDDILAALKKI